MEVRLFPDKPAIPVQFVRNIRARRYVMRMKRGPIIRITIPRGGNFNEVQRFIERHAKWLRGQYVKLASQPTTPKNWEHGTLIWFRGELVPIEVYEFNGAIVLGDHVIPFRLDNQDCSHKPAQPLTSGAPVSLDTMAKAKPMFDSQSPQDASQAAYNPALQNLRPIIENHLRNASTKELIERVKELGGSFKYKKVQVREQKSRWGSCSGKGTISLNWRLIQTPYYVRDYLIIHELAHTVHMNHSDKFWELVEKHFPNYYAAQRWLRLYGAKIIRSAV